MKPSLKRTAEDILRGYHKLPKYIKERREELMYPVTDRDENIGGGRSSTISKPQEQMVITIEQDEELRALKREQIIIDKMLAKCDEDTRRIIDELYFNSHPYYTIDGLVQQHLVLCSRTSAFRKRDRFLSELCRRLRIYVVD